MHVLHRMKGRLYNGEIEQIQKTCFCDVKRRFAWRKSKYMEKVGSSHLFKSYFKPLR